jgi:hypothetical protein
MKINIYICFVLLFYSCSSINSKKESNVIIYKDSTEVAKHNTNNLSDKEILNINLDSIKKVILNNNKKSQLSLGDTLKYQFSLEDIGTEGNEGIALYVRWKLQKIKIIIYTKMTQIHLIYEFDRSKIKVLGQIYAYREDNIDISSKKDIIEKFTYYIDMNGLPIDKIKPNRVDIFCEIKKVVPFELK